jgi:hypothetical protein
MARGSGAVRSDRSRVRDASRRRRSEPVRRRQTVPARRHVPANRIAEAGPLAPALRQTGADMTARVVEPRKQPPDLEPPGPSAATMSCASSAARPHRPSWTRTGSPEGSRASRK